jgi:hypothetical protein
MVDTAFPRTTASINRRRTWKWITGLVCAALLVAWAWLGSIMLRTEPRDYSTTRLSDKMMFRVTILPDAKQIPINELHTWKLHVESPSGTIINNAVITVDGDMPEHGHGLPTQPEVTEYLGNGDYLVEGMKFQMTGWWVMEFNIAAGDQTDHVSFNLELK